MAHDPLRAALQAAGVRRGREIGLVLSEIGSGLPGFTCGLQALRVFCVKNGYFAIEIFTRHYFIIVCAFSEHQVFSEENICVFASREYIWLLCHDYGTASNPRAMSQRAA